MPDDVKMIFVPEWDGVVYIRRLNYMNEAIDRPEPIRPMVRYAKVGRNHLCPCGSGKKFKRCCLGK